MYIKTKPPIYRGFQQNDLELSMGELIGSGCKDRKYYVK